jgi:hypothetical protein
MKTLLFGTLIAMTIASSIVPAYARTHCYMLNGQMICCIEGKTLTTCS